MPESQWKAVESYINDSLGITDPTLDAVLAANAAAGLPAIDVAPNHGKLLQLLGQIQGSRKILEIGTLGGYSTIWLARGLLPGGLLVTLEADPKHAAVAEANIAGAGFSEVVTVRVGPALDTLPKIEEEGIGPFDLIFIDANKTSYPEYLTWALKLSRRGSIIVADNMVRNGAVIDENSSDQNVQGVRRVFEMLSSEPRISATALQTVGHKGYDGFLIGVVVSD